MNPLGSTQAPNGIEAITMISQWHADTLTLLVYYLRCISARREGAIGQRKNEKQ